MKNASSSPLKSIAQEVGLSQSTVSIVLNGRGDEMRIAKTTQQKIMEAARNKDYRPNIYARRLRKSGATNGRIVGIFWSSLFLDESMGRFFKGATRAVEQDQLDCEFMIRFFTPQRLHELREQFSAWQFNGIIISGASSEDVAFLETLGHEIPIVMSNDGGGDVSGISVDHYQLGRQCAQQLISHGHSRIAMVGVDRKSPGSSIRMTGFLDSCNEHGLAVPEEWVIAFDSHDNAACSEAMDVLFTGKDHPTAIYVLRDTHAVDVILALRERGIVLDRDCTLLVHGINETMRVLAPNISYVDITMDQFAKYSIDLIVTLMNNHITAPLKRVITPEIRCEHMLRLQSK